MLLRPFQRLVVMLITAGSDDWRVANSFLWGNGEDLQKNYFRLSMNANASGGLW